MGTRTIQILGKAYAESGDVSVVATANGTEIYNNTVPTTPGARPVKNPSTNYEVLFTFDLDDTVGGTAIPSSITVTGGDLIIVTYAADKINVNDFAEFVPNWGSEVKTNLTLDGEAVSKVRGPGDDGTWHFVVPDGSVATMDWNIRDLPWGVPGKERGPSNPFGAPALGPRT